jgi:cell division protein FtsI/penicillin-binding protein 2
MAERPRQRLWLVSLLLTVGAIVIVARLVHLQVISHRTYGADLHRQTYRELRQPPRPRGLIRDRNGDVLVANGLNYSIEAELNALRGEVTGDLSDQERAERISNAAAALAVVLQEPADNIRALLDTDGPWVKIAFPVSREVGEQVGALGIRGIVTHPVWVRVYPEGSLAAHVLGFTSLEGGEGFYGVEGQYDSWLRPYTQHVSRTLDAFGDELPSDVLPLVMPERGSELVLTIDRTVQALAEEELAHALEEYQATGGTIIVMDPRTFEILAMASAPTYDPARYYDYWDQPTPPYEDPAVSKQYEPGSVFKVLTVAAALDCGVATPETTFEDPGWIEVGGQVFHNYGGAAYGHHDMVDVFVHSINTTAARLAVLMGPDTFYRYMQAFGIGQPTGVDLMGEVAGQLWLPTDYEHWYDGNLGANSFGQALAVTPLQMIVAVATVANDGARLRPHIVLRRVAPDGSVIRYQTIVEAQAISPQTARRVSEMLAQALEEALPQARVEGYRIAGKTGTAEIPIPGGYDPENTIVTYIGYGPLPNPRLIILVKLDRPQKGRLASESAVPTFQRLASRLFVMLNIPPQAVALAETAP